MNEFIIGIGKKIKEIRKDKQKTISQVASDAGVSNGLISRIENGRTIPSVPVLFSIIDALDTEVSEFFLDMSFNSGTAYLVCRKEEYKIIEKEEEAKGFSYKHILSKQLSSPGFEAVLLEIEPNSEREKVTTDAMELKFILSGSCTYIIGEEEVPLQKGDTLFFDGRIPHVPVNRGSEPSEMLVIYFYL